jgi:hypothetical protein
MEDASAFSLPDSVDAAPFIMSGTVHRAWKLGQRVLPEDLAADGALDDGPRTIGRKAALGGPRKPGSGGGSGSRSSASLSDLVASGIMVPGKGKITVTYKGTTVTANLSEDGTIEHQGRKYNSATAFSINMKRSITPSKQGDDGWKSVFYEGRPLEHYRKVYQQQFKSCGGGGGGGSSLRGDDSRQEARTSSASPVEGAVAGPSGPAAAAAQASEGRQAGAPAADAEAPGSAAAQPLQQDPASARPTRGKR